MWTFCDVYMFLVALKDGRKPYDADQSCDPNALKDYVNKIKLLEYDYNALHSKRLQDVWPFWNIHSLQLLYNTSPCYI